MLLQIQFFIMRSLAKLNSKNYVFEQETAKITSAKSLELMQPSITCQKVTTQTLQQGVKNGQS